MEKELFERFQEEAPEDAVTIKPLKGAALKKRLKELGLDDDGEAGTPED